MKKYIVALGIVLGVVLVASITYAAYTILTFQTDLTVTEAITSSEPLLVTVEGDPGETVSRTVTLHNAGAEPLDITLTGVVTPSGQGVTVILTPGVVTVPNSGPRTATFDEDIVISPSAIPGTYTVEIVTSR